MSDAPAPGYYPDPKGAAPHRWWDGTRWTEATADSPSADPPVESVTPPAATPPVEPVTPAVATAPVEPVTPAVASAPVEPVTPVVATPPPVAPSSDATTRISPPSAPSAPTSAPTPPPPSEPSPVGAALGDAYQDLGPRLRANGRSVVPRSFERFLGGLGASMIGFGLISAAQDASPVEGVSAPAILIGVAAIVAGYVAQLRLTSLGDAIGGASVALAIFGSLLITIGFFNDSDSSSGFWLWTVLLLAMYVSPVLFGRPSLLTTALIALWFAINADDVNDPINQAFNTNLQSSGDVGTISLLLAAVALVAVVLLDRGGLPRIADSVSAFAIVSIIFGLTGALDEISIGSSGLMWLSAAVSLPASAYGALAGRRALALFGATVAVASVWFIALDIGTSDQGEENGFLILVLAGIAGGAIVGLAPQIARLQQSLTASPDGADAES